MTDLHLVWSWSAAGSLRGALRQKKNVMRADQAPDLGPLDDGRRRGAFFRELWGSVGNSTDEFGDDFFPADAYSEWDAILSAIAETTPDRILIWTSDSGADYVFLRMAAHFLRDHQASLWQVRVNTGDHFRSVASVPGDTLVAFLPAATKIDVETARSYDAEFETMAANPSLLRMATANGQLTYHDLSVFDDAIVGFCSWEWRRVVHVVADTMGHADNLNPPGDILIFSRLLHLVRTGKLELEGEFTSIYEDEFRKKRVRIRPTP